MKERLKSYFKELIKKPSKIIVSLISTICIFLCIFITIEVVSANNENRPPCVFGVSVSYVPTESMKPTINAQDYIVFTKVDFEDIKEQDIIVYNKTDENKFVVHRVIEVHEGYVITQGDNRDTNPLPDIDINTNENFHVTPDKVFGRYAFTISFLSFMSGGVNRNAIFMILIILAFLMIITQVVSIIVKYKKEQIEEEAKERKKKQQALMLEEMRKQILEEELAKIRKQKENMESE